MFYCSSSKCQESISNSKREKYESMEDDTKYFFLDLERKKQIYVNILKILTNTYSNCLNCFYYLISNRTSQINFFIKSFLSLDQVKNKGESVKFAIFILKMWKV